MSVLKNDFYSLPKWCPQKILISVCLKKRQNFPVLLFFRSLFFFSIWGNILEACSLFTVASVKDVKRLAQAGSFKLSFHFFSPFFRLFLPRVTRWIKRTSLNTFGKIDKNISCLSFVYLISNANLQWLGGTSQGFSLLPVCLRWIVMKVALLITVSDV